MLSQSTDSGGNLIQIRRVGLPGWRHWGGSVFTQPPLPVPVPGAGTYSSSDGSHLQLETLKWGLLFKDGVSQRTLSWSAAAGFHLLE